MVKLAVAFALAVLTAGSAVKAQQALQMTGSLVGPLVVGGVDGKRTTLSLSWKSGHTTALKAEAFLFTMGPLGVTITADDVEAVTREGERTFTTTLPSLRMDVRNSGLVSITPK